MTIKLEASTEKQLSNSIQRYFTENLDMSIGNLESATLLDFILKEIGPSIYNQAISDAQNRLLQRVQELDIEVHETEFNYWNGPTKRR